MEVRHGAEHRFNNDGPTNFGTNTNGVDFSDPTRPLTADEAILVNHLRSNNLCKQRHGGRGRGHGNGFGGKRQSQRGGMMACNNSNVNVFTVSAKDTTGAASSSGEK